MGPIWREEENECHTTATTGSSFRVMSRSEWDPVEPFLNGRRSVAWWGGGRKTDQTCKDLPFCTNGPGGSKAQSSWKSAAPASSGQFLFPLYFPPWHISPD